VLLEKLVQADGVGDEDERDHDRQPREVALDDVRAALGRRREAHATESSIATGVHQDQPEQGERNEHVPDRERLQHLEA